jgi:hypothetical protein
MSRTGVAHTEAVETQDQRDAGLEDEEKKKKSRRPANTAFRQQRLKAWQYVSSPSHICARYDVLVCGVC